MLVCAPAFACVWLCVQNDRTHSGDTRSGVTRARRTFREMGAERAMAGLQSEAAPTSAAFPWRSHRARGAPVEEQAAVLACPVYPLDLVDVPLEAAWDLALVGEEEAEKRLRPLLARRR